MTTLGAERGTSIDLRGLTDSPPAQRAQRPKWAQFRFLAGVLLVVGSVLLGAKVLAGADQSSVALAASRQLDAGMTITQDDVAEVKVRLYEHPDLYLTGAIPPGYIVVRPVARGELIPRGALGRPADLPVGHKMRQVTVPVQTGHFPPGVGVGDIVDVYATARSSSEPGTATALLLAAVEVDHGTSTSSGGLGGSSGSSVVLTVPEERVNDLVTALQQADLDIVLVAKAGER